MKQVLLFAMFVIVFTVTVQAQNAIAKIKYEQAEEAFLKNDFHTAITRLDEAQKLLGASNPKILYLRLMAGKGVISGGNYDYDLLASARKDARLYIKQYGEIEGIEEKFRQVYEFSETLEALPETKDLFEQQKSETARKRAEWVKARAIKVSDSLMTAYMVKKCVTVKEFETYNLRAFIGLTKQKNQANTVTYLNTWNQNSIAGPLQIIFNNNGLYLYSYTVLGETDPATAKKVYQSLIDIYPSGMDSTTATRREIGPGTSGQEIGILKLLPAATGNRGNIRITYLNFVGGKAYVIISFDPQGE